MASPIALRRPGIDWNSEQIQELQDWLNEEMNTILSQHLDQPEEDELFSDLFDELATRLEQLEEDDEEAEIPEEEGGSPQDACEMFEQTYFNCTGEDWDDRYEADEEDYSTDEDEDGVVKDTKDATTSSLKPPAAPRVFSTPQRSALRPWQDGNKDDGWRKATQADYFDEDDSDDDDDDDVTPDDHGREKLLRRM